MYYKDLRFIMDIAVLIIKNTGIAWIAIPKMVNVLIMTIFLLIDINKYHSQVSAQRIYLCLRPGAHAEMRTLIPNMGIVAPLFLFYEEEH